jgi:hypothetical protein
MNQSTLIEREAAVRAALYRQAAEVKALYDQLSATSDLPLDKSEITKAILLRMKAYYESHGQVKQLLNKRYVQDASDFFVETILFYVKVLHAIKKTGIEVHSERQIHRKRGAIRPDISLWMSDRVVGIIECKTQLGWNRDRWETDFRKREQDLKASFPDAVAFLVVMSAGNWRGFPQGHNDVGRIFFALSSGWPAGLDEDTIDGAILNPIEPLLKETLKLA